jgi:hypothetical protein
VLEVGHRGGSTAENRGIEQAAPSGEQAEREDAATDLEAPVGDVLVRHAIARDVQRRTEQKRERARTHNGSHRRPRRDMQRDDHRPIIAHATLVA